MKQYLDATQKVLDKVFPRIEPDWLRLEIDGDTELDKGILQVDAVMVDSKPYSVFRHYCGHEDRQPCTMELIKEVI